MPACPRQVSERVILGESLSVTSQLTVESTQCLSTGRVIANEEAIVCQITPIIQIGTRTNPVPCPTLKWLIGSCNPLLFLRLKPWVFPKRIFGFPTALSRSIFAQKFLHESFGLHFCIINLHTYWKLTESISTAIFIKLLVSTYMKW